MRRSVVQFSSSPRAWGTRTSNGDVAVITILGFPWIVDQLIAISDVMADWVLGGELRDPDLASDFLVPFDGGIGGTIGRLIPVVIVYLGIALIYLELVVRNSLIYVVVALAPLSFMAMTMPAAKAAARKSVELVVAVILIKPGVFVALRVGFDLGRPGLGRPSPDESVWGETFVGLAIVLIAAFVPWIIWRLVPMAEQAMIAQGLSRAPFRAGMQAMQLAYFGSALAGRARSGSGGSGSKPGSGGNREGGLGPPRTLAGPGSSSSRSTRPMTRESDGLGDQRRGAGQAGIPGSVNRQSGPVLAERVLGDRPPGGRAAPADDPPPPPPPRPDRQGPGGRRGPAGPRTRS
ncbi:MULTISPECIES: hypothetical protein [Parafrankia]|nr:MULTISPECIES: hypothetical protein [Parafrankia]MBE3200210.1 hypothetical protein [Parafrankia sp. CH37]